MSNKVTINGNEYSYGEIVESDFFDDKSKEIVLIANGKSKAQVMKQLHDCTAIDPMFPACFLLLHPNVTVICDNEAASLISSLR